MYILKNSLKNLLRNKGRNILMGVIIFAIIFTTAISIIINTTSGAIIKDYKARFGSEVTIAPDYTKISNMKDAQNEFKPITPDQYFSFGESSFLQDSYYTASLDAITDNLKTIPLFGTNNVTTVFPGQGVSGSGKMVAANIKIMGFSRLDLDDDFKKGLRKVIDGKEFSGTDECIISQAFAKLNSLKVGDKIKVDSIYSDNKMTHEFTVCGIYMDNTSLGQNQASLSSIIDRGNEIITDTNTVSKMEMFKTSGTLTATYFLKDPGMLPQFKAEMKEKGLNDYYDVTTDETSYKKIVEPVEGLAKISVTFMVVVLILGSLILILLSSLAIRERKYEIGVLRAMGMKKRQVALGFLSEMLVVTAICLITGIGAGALSSQPVADLLLKNQVEIAKQTTSSAATLGVISVNSNGAADKAEPLSKLKVSLTPDAILQIVIISLLLAGVSSFAGILYITKYEPMKILSERN